MSLCNEFNFIATDSAANIGYQKSTDADFVINYFDSENKSRCEQLICNADAVIFGSCPNGLISMRMALHKLSFLYSERFFKKGTWRRFIPTTRKRLTERIIKYKDEPMYVLCAGAYLPYDLSLLGFPQDKCYKWGYFPQVKREDITGLFEQRSKNEKVSILWAGRLIGWKHPEACIMLARTLKEKSYNFEINIIGDGEMKADLAASIHNCGLEDCVHMLGGMTSDEVRANMEKSDIFLFTSDRNEGWGAVLNEAMNSGCAVVANGAIGSVPYLLNNGKNGFIYNTPADMQKYAELLIQDVKLRRALGTEAYNTIINKWNAETAGKRFLSLTQELLVKDKCGLFEDGPCSRVSSEGKNE